MGGGTADPSPMKSGFPSTYSQIQILVLHNGIVHVRAVTLPQHDFLVGLCLQTAVDHVSKSDK